VQVEQGKTGGIDQRGHQYIVRNGGVEYDPLQEVPTLSMRFSTDPESVFLTSSARPVPSAAPSPHLGGVLDRIENRMWSCACDGTSTEDGKVVIHCNGDWSFNAMVSHVGTVNGQSGTLEMSVAGSLPDGESEWHGRWVILSGTEGLATLRGQGPGGVRALRAQENGETSTMRECSL
jgi:hypothetical protein